MQRLLPAPAHPVSIDDAYTAPLGQHHDRPWVGLCMVASLDGSTVVDGLSAGLSSDNDTGVLLRLRALADVIIVGAGTASGEGYGPPSKVGQRIGVVTARGNVDTSTDLFTSGAGFVITTLTSQFEARGVDVIRAGTNEVDLADAISQIPALSPGAQFVQAEGGPTLNGALAAADLLDELNVTTSPATVGGSGPRLVSSAPDHSNRYDLRQLVVDDEGFVFSRWRRRRSPAPASP
ncbi:MAG: dihydrofolate reductase family protein [Ilumatobacter sp.]